MSSEEQEFRDECCRAIMRGMATDDLERFALMVNERHQYERALEYEAWHRTCHEEGSAGE